MTFLLQKYFYYFFVFFQICILYFHIFVFDIFVFNVFVFDVLFIFYLSDISFLIPAFKPLTVNGYMSMISLMALSDSIQ